MSASGRTAEMVRIRVGVSGSRVGAVEPMPGLFTSTLRHLQTRRSVDLIDGRAGDAPAVGAGKGSAAGHLPGRTDGDVEGEVHTLSRRTDIWFRLESVEDSWLEFVRRPTIQLSAASPGTSVIRSEP
jgi:hypothetical protein